MTKEILTQERLKELLHYDPDTGVFTWLISVSRRKRGDVAGNKWTSSYGNSYIRIGVLKKSYYAHCLAWLYMMGRLPMYEIDHEDGNGVHNQWVNLRHVDHGENQKNIRLSVSNKSGVVGVYKDKASNKWRAVICVNGKNIHLGSHAKKPDAIIARKEAEERYGFHINHGLVRSYIGN